MIGLVKSIYFSISFLDLIMCLWSLRSDITSEKVPPKEKFIDCVSWSLSSTTELNSWYRRNWLVILTSSWKYRKTFLKYHSGINFGLYSKDWLRFMKMTYIVFSLLFVDIVTIRSFLAETEVVICAFYWDTRSFNRWILRGLLSLRLLLSYRSGLLKWGSRVTVHIFHLIYVKHLRGYLMMLIPW